MAGDEPATFVILSEVEESLAISNQKYLEMFHFSRREEHTNSILPNSASDIGFSRDFVFAVGNRQDSGSTGEFELAQRPFFQESSRGNGAAVVYRSDYH